MDKRQKMTDAALWLHSSGSMLHIYAKHETPGLLADAVESLHKAIHLLHEALHDGRADA